MTTSRRNFLKAGALAGAIGPFYSLASNADTVSEKNSGLKEPSRTLPVVQETDVIVCGGGPAGIAAAIASARTGAKTTLIEYHGCLGGIWTAGLLSNIIDYQNKPGIMKELILRLEKSDAQYSGKVYDAELMT